MRNNLRKLLLVEVISLSQLVLFLLTCLNVVIALFNAIAQAHRSEAESSEVSKKSSQKDAKKSENNSNVLNALLIFFDLLVSCRY